MSILGWNGKPSWPPDPDYFWYYIPDSLKGVIRVLGIGFRILLRGLSGFRVPLGLVVPEIYMVK